MTLRELYQNIDGDYDQAIRVLRMEKLLDKHIRRFTQNSAVEDLLAAAECMNSTQLFETAHAVKGVCANMGLMNLSNAAAEITEEFRPGSTRKLADEEVKARVDAIRKMYARTSEGIQKYEESCE